MNVRKNVMNYNFSKKRYNVVLNTSNNVNLKIADFLDEKGKNYLDNECKVSAWWEMCFIILFLYQHVSPLNKLSIYIPVDGFYFHTNTQHGIEYTMFD